MGLNLFTVDPEPEQFKEPIIKTPPGVRKARPDGKKFNCTNCGRYENCQSSRMEPFGEFQKRILIIGIEPSRLDDTHGQAFSDRNGKVLERVLHRFGINLAEDCLVMNSVNCYAEDQDKKNFNFQVECCRARVLNVIKERKPLITLLMGQAPLYSVIGSRWKKDLGSLTKWRGWRIPDQELQTWLCPVFHPSVIDQSDTGIEELIWRQDLEAVFELLNEEVFPFPIWKEPEIEILEGDLTPLNQIKPNSQAAFDYETTGLKPHAKGHRIVCASVAYRKDLVFSFMMPETRTERQPFIDFLKNPVIGKVAQNMKFEDAWSLIRLRTQVVNWTWDTMLATHILDNRTGVTGLKFQVYVQFGIGDYDSEINPWLRSSEDEKSANGLNRILELLERPGGKEKLLKYCALDSHFEFMLSEKQNNLIVLPYGNVEI